jgi:hypothetical protein
MNSTPLRAASLANDAASRGALVNLVLKEPK